MSIALTASGTLVVYDEDNRTAKPESSTAPGGSMILSAAHELEGASRSASASLARFVVEHSRECCISIIAKDSYYYI